MKRVYVCDDELDYRVLVKAVLAADAGVTVVGEGGDSRLCLDDAVRCRPDVLLLDMNMPGAHGLEVLPRLCEALPGTAILALTTGQAPEYERKVLDAGAAGYIQKPRNVFDLPGLIRDKLAEAGIGDEGAS